MEAQPPPPALPSWSSILKQQKDIPKPQHVDPVSTNCAQPSGQLVGSCKSSKGIAVAVVDANALINGGERLVHSADRFVSIPEVINEIRDPASRHSLNLLPFAVETREPSPDSLSKVTNFAKATGDLQTLSDVDLKLMALTYTLEAEIHGTQNVRETPPPIQTVNVRRLPEKDLPGWGSNVPNPEEWEALEQAFDNGSDPQSRILPTKVLNFDTNSADHQSTNNDSIQGESESHISNQDIDDSGFRKPRKYFPKKREVKIEGKKMVADGIDASQGVYNDENADDWKPAVSRNTHRRYLRRKARREMNEASSEFGDQVSKSSNCENENVDDDQCPELIDEGDKDGVNSVLDHCSIPNENSSDISASLTNLKMEEESTIPSEDIDELKCPVANEAYGVEFTDSSLIDLNEEEMEVLDQDVGSLEIATNESEGSLHGDDVGSDQSWAPRYLSESSVACVTNDYAMQNVLLQMGLRLLAPGGMQIRELHRWVLKCHACFKVTTEIGRIFCPKCGNGGTLRKVAVTVNENGIVLAGRRPRISLRGTKFSLPMPQGGRNAVEKNPILREDQLPSKFLYPKTKKKNKQEEFLLAGDIFSHHNDKKAPHRPPIRKTLAVFSGRRNPNDNHYAPRTKA